MGVPKAFSIENEESTSKYGVGLTVFLAHLRLVNSRRKIRALLVFLVSCFVFPVETSERKIRGEILRRTFVSPWSRTFSTLPAGKPRSPCLSCVLLCFPRWDGQAENTWRNTALRSAFLARVRIVRSRRKCSRALSFLRLALFSPLGRASGICVLLRFPCWEERGGTQAEIRPRACVLFHVKQYAVIFAS